jgi:parallel beta-helix repeat protein
MMRLSAILCIAAVVLLAGAPGSVGDHPPTARTAVVATAVSPAPTTPPGSTCPGSVQGEIDAVPAGGEVLLPPCVIRETLSVARPMTLRGVAGTEIRGSDVWTDWRADGGAWRSTLVLPVMPAHGECVPGTTRCLLPEEVFRDGVALLQVDGDPVAGEFGIDAERHVRLGADPASHTIEVGIRPRWIVVTADNVAIEDIVMRHATNDAQSGALQDDGHAIVVRDCVLSDAHGANVWLTGRSELLDSEVANAGQLGIGVGGARVAGNHVHDNGTEGFDPGWEAGGFKAVTHDVVVEGNEFDHNAGSGIWFDIGSSGIVVRDNRVHDNLRVGIFVEISSDVRVTANTVWSNGREGDGWLNGAGILVHTSTRVEVDHNLVAWNGDGIGVESQDRPDRPTDAPTDVRVHDNDVLMEDGPDTKIALGWVEDWSGPLFDPASHNGGEANRFWYPAPEGDFDRFAWAGPMSRLADFMGTPGGRDSSYLSDDAAFALLALGDVPAAPEAGVGPGDGGDAGARVQRAELELVGLLLALLLVVSLAGVRVGAVPARRVVVTALLVALGYALVVMAISRVDLVPDPLEGIALVTTVGIEVVALGVVGLVVGRAVLARRRRDRSNR